MGAFASASTVADLVALLLIFLITVPTLLSFYGRVKRKAKANGNGYEEVHKLYEDRDGVATEESQREFSAAIPTYIALSGCVVGFLASVVMAVFASIRSTGTLIIEEWLIFGSWVWIMPISLLSRY
jgi:hypothetical protein